jgi:predicted acetyltransferase
MRQVCTIAAANSEAALDPSPVVDLEPVRRDRAAVLANLLELYLHDMSAIFPIEPAADGRFGYEGLSRYWSEPDRRFPFFIVTGGRIVGFALATRGSPASNDPTDFDVAEFFVLRRHRRSGVGRDAAFALWRRLPGRWIVRVSVANREGLPFWRRIVDQFTGGTFEEHGRPGTPSEGRVLTFVSPEPDSDG